MVPPLICSITWGSRHDHPCHRFGGLSSRSFSFACSIWFPSESSCLLEHSLERNLPHPQPRLRHTAQATWTHSPGLAFEWSSVRIEKISGAYSYTSSGLWRLSIKSCSLLLKDWFDAGQFLRVVLPPTLQLFETQWLSSNKSISQDGCKVQAHFISSQYATTVPFL